MNHTDYHLTGRRGDERIREYLLLFAEIVCDCLRRSCVLRAAFDKYDLTFYCCVCR